ncbi:MAG: hypothetical protein LBQ43_04215, partial [Holosporales bacterium]|nr:hypothetical protein [Holosporales bacterium]
MTKRRVSLLSPRKKHFPVSYVDSVLNLETQSFPEIKYVAIDAMGGDFGPAVVIEGVRLASLQIKKQSTANVHFVFFGNQAAIEEQLNKHPNLLAISSIVHTDIFVTNEMKPIDALRHKDDSNLGMALNSVARGDTHAVVSAANTGAYVTLAKVILGTLPGIDRPAI